MNVRNYIHLTGNLGATPKTYVLPSGDFSCKFKLATNDYYRNKAGERVTTTEWHTVRAYGKLAELFAEHLDKGSQISIVGSMRYRRWEDKFEQSRLSAEVIAREFTFLSPKLSNTEDPQLDARIETAADGLAVSDAPEPAKSKTRKAPSRRVNDRSKAAATAG